MSDLTSSSQSPENRQSYRFAWIAMLGALTALGPLSIDMYLSALPSIAQEFGISTIDVATTLPAYFCGLALGQLIYGPISDRFGRKPPLYFGLVLFCIASIACMFATQLELLLIARVTQALGGCVGMVIVRATIRDCLSPTQSAKAFSSMVLIMGIAPILAPLFGGWLLTHLGWHSIFAALAIFSTACLVMIHFGFSETLTIESRRPLALKNVFITYGLLLKDSSFRTPALAGAFSYASMFAYIGAASAILMDHFGVSAQHFGVYFGINALGVIGMSQVNGRLVGRFHILQLLKTGSLLQVISGIWILFLALTGQDTLISVMVGLFGVVAGIGLTGANSNALALAQQGNRAGSASALQGSVQFTLSLCSGLVVHSLMFNVLTNLAIVIVSFTLISFGLILMISARNKRLAML
ncbi:MAG: multidrug effflux MFS transporter [Gammaproteobacteria bacterium]|nr:multidrug effflux MFS transporter [Gammaproteobacteria bacterium]